jgi:purine-binding chemotaxis protein CheW
MPADEAAAEPSKSAPMESAENLERIFAVTDDMALATEESYAAMLQEQVIAESQNLSQYLAFHLDDEEYALDIKQISEIIKVREFTEIPRSPEFVLGIISLRGVVVPVFDLRCRLNLGAAEITSTSRIVVCQSGDVKVGLLVDSINQVVNLDNDEVEPPPGVLSGLDREMVFGIGRYEGRMVILLQLNHVLDVDLN